MRFKIPVVVLILGLLPVLFCHKRKQPAAPDDTPPTAFFTVTPDTGELDSTYRVDASGSADDEDRAEDLLVRWDWESDGTWDTYFTTAKTDSHVFAEPGLKSISMELKDTDGNRDTAIVQVLVRADNLPPAAQFAVLPLYGDTSTLFSVDASFCTDDRDSLSDLQVRWDWEDDGTWDEDWSTTKTAATRYATDGVKTIRLEVRDADSLTNSVTKQVTVNPDRSAPVAAFTITPPTGDTATTFTFDASSSSDGQDALSALDVRWDWDDDGLWDVDWTIQKTADMKFGAAGIRTIRLEVRDTDSMTSTATTQLQVVESGSGNTAPTASFTLNQTTGDVTTVFSVDAAGCSDLEDNTADLLVRWDWNDDGTYDTPWSTVKNATQSYSRPGEYAIRLEVMDTDSLKGTVARNVTVNNTAPAAAFSVTPQTGTVTTGFTVDAYGCTDREDLSASLEVRWQWEQGGTWTAFGPAKTDTHYYTRHGVKEITLEVRDTDSLVSSLTKTITVDNTPPTAAFTVSPAFGTLDTVFRVNASGCTDPEDSGPALVVRWDWENDGTWDTPFTATKTASHQYITEGSKTIRLQVMDTDSATAEYSNTISIGNSSNTPPTATFTVTPDSGYPGTIFRVDASGCTDAQDSTSRLTVQWDWDDNGVFDTDSTTVKTDSHAYAAPGPKTIRLLVTDSEGLAADYAVTVLVKPFGQLTDTRDGKTYKTVTIGSQEWMAENLNIGIYKESMNTGSTHSDVSDNGIIEKYANDNDTAHFAIYGGLYDWDEAMGYDTTAGGQGICPDGWHLPTDAEWQTLEQYLGMPAGVANNTGYRGTDEGTQLKAGGSSNFEALLSGYRQDDGSFWPERTYTWFWCSSQNSATKAWCRALGSTAPTVYRDAHPKTLGFCVRCVKGQGNVGTANTPPTAAFTVTPDSGYPGTIFSVDASGCGDAEDGTAPLTVEWDWDDDGVFDTSPTAVKTDSHTYDDAGTKTIRLKVTDSGGLTAEQTVTVTVKAYGQLTDTRDGKTYKTVTIGTQTWMAANLNAGSFIHGSVDAADNATIEKYAWENIESNADTLGGLYRWNEAMGYDTTRGVQGICPDGWHIPSDEEWDTLVSFVGTDDQTIALLKGGVSGFDAVYTGYMPNRNIFESINTTSFWTSSWNGSYPYHRNINSNHPYVMRNTLQLSNMAACVRCIKGQGSVGTANTPPTAAFTVSSASGYPGTIFGVDASGCSDAEDSTAQLTVAWDWDDDGVFDTSPTAVKTDSHTYDDAGQKTIRLKVTDSGGLTVEHTVTVTVKAYGQLTDTRDGQTYRTLIIGGQEWMAENLNVGVYTVSTDTGVSDNGIIEKYAYNNDTTYFKTHGGLYEWDEAMGYGTAEGVQGICPDGWHLPTVADWRTLVDTVGGLSTGGTALKAGGSSGFHALFSGYANRGNFSQMGNSVNFWSSSSYNATTAWNRYLYNTSTGVFQNLNNKTNGFCVRCIKN